MFEQRNYFYYDKDFFYLGMKSRDFFILPKSRFTIGDPAEFEEFIYKKSIKFATRRTSYG